MTTSDKRYTLKLTYIRLLEFNKRLIECYNPICAEVYVILQSVSSDERKKHKKILKHLHGVLETYLPFVVVDWVMGCIGAEYLSSQACLKLKRELEYIKDKFDFDNTYVEVYYAFVRLLDWSIKTDQNIQIYDGD